MLPIAASAAQADLRRSTMNIIYKFKYTYLALAVVSLVLSAILQLIVSINQSKSGIGEGYLYECNKCGATYKYANGVQELGHHIKLGIVDISRMLRF